MIEKAKDPAAAVMRLTPRDRALIEVLGEVRYLTAAQIQQVCYPSASVETTRHRLSLLKKRGVLTFLAHRTFEDRRAFWGLSPAGRTAAEAVAAAEHGAPAAAPPRARAVAALQIEHLIATNQVFCDLCAQHRAGRLGAFRWLGSQRRPGTDMGGPGRGGGRGPGRLGGPRHRRPPRKPAARAHRRDRPSIHRRCSAGR